MNRNKEPTALANVRREWVKFRSGVEEIGCGLWLPHTIKHRALLENVKLRATEFIVNYPQNMTYNDRNGLTSPDIRNYLQTFEPRF